MKLFKLAALATVLMFGAVQAQDKAVEMKVIVAGDDHDINWTSGDMGFNPEDLAVGESRTVTGESGETVTFTRTDDGMQLEVEGKTIMLPEIGAHGAHVAFADGDAKGHNFDVEVLAIDGEAHDVQILGSHAVRAHSPDGVTIISGTALDDSVKESIRSVLISAGHDEAVRFVDISSERPQVRVIKKHVEVVP